MLIAMSDLFRYSVPVEDGSHTIADIFLEPSTWLARHVVLDTGSFVAPHAVLVPFNYLHKPDPDARSVRLKPEEKALESAPLWASADKQGDAAPSGLAAVAEPLSKLVPDAIKPDAEHTSDPDPEARRIASGKLRLRRLLGLPVTGAEEVLGKVEDLVLDWNSGCVTHIVVDNGVSLPGRQLLVEIDRFDAPVPDAGCVSTSMTAAQLEQEPQIEESDSVERHWLDTARTYYGL